MVSVQNADLEWFAGIERACSTRSCDADAAQALVPVHALVARHPTRAHGLALAAALEVKAGDTFAETRRTMQAALEGHPNGWTGAATLQRAVWEVLVQAWGLPAARSRALMGPAERERRYRRLIAVLCEACYLNRSEADGALRQLLRAAPHQRSLSCAANQAVANRGGNLAAVQQAFRLRKQVHRPGAFAPA
jgi:hypothetical protein